MPFGLLFGTIAVDKGFSVLLRFPFLGGELDRISALSIFVWRKYARIV